MRPIHLLFLSLLAITIALASCEKSPVTTSGPAVIMPLNLGNRWIGNWTIFDSVTGSASSTSMDTTEITAEMVIDGERWWNEYKSLYRTNRADGLYSRFLSLIDPIQTAKYPAMAGDTFSTRRLIDTMFGVPGEPYISFSTVVSTNRAITVPAGTFSCYEYTLSNKFLNDSSGRVEVHSHSYYAPGVGHVKFEVLSQGPNNTMRVARHWELVEYTLK
jgi:hypothetical protein